MKLVIIEGPSSTGKSTLARKLSKDLKIPAFLRDDYKERQYDLLASAPSLKQLSKIDSASRQELLEAIKDSVGKKTSLIVESNFLYSEGHKIKNLIQKDTTVVEIFCFANGFRVFKRYVRRNKSGERHKGHRDHLWYSIVALEALGPIKLRYRPFRLSKNVLMVDANNFSKIDDGAIRKFVTEAK